MMRNIRFIIVVLLFAGAKQSFGNKLNGVNIIRAPFEGKYFFIGESNIKGRLLTPKEGCGLAKVKNTRIVGGSEAPVGSFPWMCALGFLQEDDTIDFDCGEILLYSFY